jgi:iron complex transport system substrate-binding protein
MDGGAAAILRELGLADRVVGTAAPDFFAAFPAEDRADLERIPVIDDGTGNREAVIAAEPDLVMGISTYEFGAFDGTPTRAELADAGIAALVACDDGGPENGIDDTLAFVRQTADVFGVPERGADLADRLEKELAEAAAPAEGADPVRVLAASVAPAAGQGVSTLGAPSTTHGIITAAGGENIAGDIDQRMAEISTEEVVRRDPQVILVLTGFSPATGAEITDALRAAPSLAATSAVRDDRFVVLPQSIATSPSVLNPQAVARLAAALHGGADR